MPQKFDNLSALDWDDSELLKAYHKGLQELEEKKQGTFKEDKRNSNTKNKWKVGDFCCAIYYGDDLLYEARIIAISDDTCTVEYLGYDEVADVDLDSLTESQGKKARRKQLKRARASATSIDGRNSVNRESETSACHSPNQHHSGKRHHRSHNLTANNTTAAETTFHNSHPMVHFNGMPSMSMMPPAPPMPHCSEVAQNPSLCAMLTSWYMAGYYTGLHQAQKNKCHQHYCCQPGHCH